MLALQGTPSIHDSMFGLQGHELTEAIHDSMNRKLNLLLIFTFYDAYLNHKNIYDLGNKTVLYLICNRINGFVRV